MSSIFISHSKNDTEIVNVFLRAFQDTRVNPILMEYEKSQNPPWSEIRTKISLSSALFVLLGPNLKNSDYTQNWVNYEVGLADGLNKQIWVFEDVKNETIFPIPHVHHYLIYDQTRIESLDYLQNIVKSYSINSDGFVGGLILGVAITKDPIGAIIGGLIGSQVNIPTKPTGVRLQCPYNDCRVIFEFYNTNQQLRCPSCRRVMTWTKST